MLGLQKYSILTEAYTTQGEPRKANQKLWKRQNWWWCSQQFNAVSKKEAQWWSVQLPCLLRSTANREVWLWLILKVITLKYSYGQDCPQCSMDVWTQKSPVSPWLPLSPRHTVPSIGLILRPAWKLPKNVVSNFLGGRATAPLTPLNPDSISTVRKPETWISWNPGEVQSVWATCLRVAAAGSTELEKWRFDQQIVSIA